MNPNTSEARRNNAWSRDRYGIPYAQLCALVALVVGYRMFDGRPIVSVALENVLQNVEDIQEVYMAPLERLGLVKAVGKFGRWGNQVGYVPTRLALQKFPEVLDLASTAAVDADAARGAA
jgi:hypothetical protein